MYYLILFFMIEVNIFLKNIHFEINDTCLHEKYIYK